jgi:hypothetical protein
MNASDAELEASIESCDRWEWACGGLVVVGVVAAILIAACHPAYDSFWEQWGSALADGMVALGVVGEIKFGLMASVRQDELQRRLRDRVAEANARAAEANARAAEANRKALEATLALAKFSAPRSISVELRNRVVEQMIQFAPQSYTGRVSAGSDDAWELWREISLALELAGWIRVGPTPPIGRPPYGPPATIAAAALPGVMIWFPAIGRPDTRPKAVALAKALRDNGDGILAAPGPTADTSNIIAIEIGPNPHLPASAYHGADP